MDSTPPQNGHRYGPERRIMPHQPEKYLPGGWIVQKFGGTSVGKFAPAIVEDIVRAGLHKSRIAVVCSARSSYTKADGTTNRLLRAAQEAKSGGRKYDSIVEAIRVDHIQAGKDHIRSEDIAKRFSEKVTEECEKLINILESAQHLEVFIEQVTDKIISRGEMLSCRFMTALLQDRGVDAQYIDLSNIVVSKDFNKMCKDVTATLATKILECGNKVPVITGYFGPVPGGILKAVGRGYTDLCAAFAAISVQARELQIWKEVDGIFTADPRKVPTAKLIPKIKPAEAAELTFYGSEVIHPFTMEQVMREHIPVRIKNVMNPKNSGTVIEPEETDHRAPLRTPPGIVRKRTSSSVAGFGHRPKRPTAVTIKPNIVVMNVHSNKRVRAHGFLMKIFQTLDENNLSVDLISSSEVHVSLALHSDSAMLSGEEGEEEVKIQNKDLQLAYDDLKEYGNIDLVPGMAILSLVGQQLNNMVGMAGKFFSVLGENHINIEMISQGASTSYDVLPPVTVFVEILAKLIAGASEINISCVIEEREADRALNVVHTNLFTFLDY